MEQCRFLSDDYNIIYLSLHRADLEHKGHMKTTLKSRENLT